MINGKHRKLIFESLGKLISDASEDAKQKESQEQDLINSGKA
jgi:hypothetical protein